jgi:flagellar motor protein MotB
MKLIISILFFAIFVPALKAQVLTLEQLKTAPKNQYYDAITFAQNKEFSKAIVVLNKLVTALPKFQDGWLSLAGIQAELKKYDSSVICFKNAFALDSGLAVAFKLPYSISLAGNGKFTEALQAVNSFLAQPKLSEKSLKSGNYRKTCYETALSLIKKQARENYSFKPMNLGAEVNTYMLEYYPSINLSNNYLVFNRRVIEKNNYQQEDFFQAFKKDNKWQNAGPLQGGLNTQDNEAAQTISANGNYMVFTACNFMDGYGSCDLFYSTFNGKDWSPPKNLGENINTEFWESAPSLSPDGKDLYFTSNRSFSNYGGKDIFVSHRLPNGKWSEAENAGPEINTAADEASPFMHFDNETLYFLCNGHKGIGGDDLFFAKKINDTLWGEPQNLGYPINTIENEGSLTISTNGTTGYFASDRAGGFGGLDIYSFEVPNNIAPLKTTWLKATVIDSITKQGLTSSIDLVDRQTNKKIMQVLSNENGEFIITLPAGKNYDLYIKRKGYFFYQENFSINLNMTDSTLSKTIMLQSLAINKNYEVKNIFFATKAFNIDATSYAALDQLVEILKLNPTTTIQIEGHTDNVGTPKDNLALSVKRAETIKNYLLIKGIANQRLISKGFGNTKPKAKGNTEEARATNRRTEIKIIKL